MTNIEILEKSLSIVSKKGYLLPNKFSTLTLSEFASSEMFYYPVIFSHDFAKAFWGEKDLCADCGEDAEKNFDDGICKNCCEGLSWDDNGPGDMDDDPAWKYHLRKMVTEVYPIKYLEKFL